MNVPGVIGVKTESDEFEYPFEDMRAFVAGV
jgi:hypothetical protein